MPQEERVNAVKKLKKTSNKRTMLSFYKVDGFVL